MRRDTELYGATFFASAQVDSWVDFCTHELELACTMWLYPVIGYMPFNAKAYVVAIKPDQTLYYMAAPDGSNKKVVEEGPNNYLCVATQKHFSSFIRRYIMRCRVTDASGEAWVNVFNDQAEAIIGMKADEIAPLKEGSDPGPYTAQLRQAEFREYVLRVMTRTEEYEGEARRRLTIQSAVPVSFAAESKATLAKIQALLSPAVAPVA